MRTKFLINFIKLTEYKNFSTLSSDLSISQSTLSNQISQLEKELGIKLVERSTRKFRITEGGKIFLKHAKKIIDIIETFKIELSENVEKETIIISASTLPGSHILPKFFANFKEKHVDVDFKVKINNSQKSIDLLNKNNADFAGIGSFMNSDEASFDHIKIGTDELVFICSSYNELVEGENLQVSFNDLIDLPFISREKGSGTRNIMEQQFPEFSNLNVMLKINDNNSIISAVSDSNYISVLSRTIAEKAEKAGLIKILQVKEHPIIAKRDIYLLKSKDKVLSNLKESFWNYLSV